MANETPQARLAIPGSKRGPKAFFAETGRELRKVNWPNRAETTRLTGIVISVCVLQALLLLGMSWIFSYLVDLFLKGAK